MPVFGSDAASNQPISATFARPLNHSALIIRNSADLNTLRDRARRYRALGGVPLQLRLHGLSATDSMRLETRLNKAWNACGCAEGAVGAVVAVGLSAFLMFTESSELNGAFAFKAALLIILAVFFGGLFGKLGGLAFANLRFRRTLKVLIKHTLANSELERSAKEI